MSTQDIGLTAKLDGQIALVTGASQGLGEAIAIRLGLNGATVLCVARNAEKLAKTVETITAAGGVAVAMECDVFGSLGAGGAAVEVLASCLALEDGQLFPTLNQDRPDSRCPIRISSDFADAGKAFIHLAYSPQGQASGVCIAKFA